jgi:hypothetical protein
MMQSRWSRSSLASSLKQSFIIGSLSEGLTCRTGDRTRTFAKAELEDWVGQRAQAGRLPPNGFPRARKFD